MATLAVLVVGGYVGAGRRLRDARGPGRGRPLASLRRVVGSALLVTLPLAVAVGLVSVFTRPGATVLFELGPFDATLEGADFAARVIVRLFVMAAALALFGLTTPPRAFVIDLERRGVSPRLAFALGAVHRGGAGAGRAGARAFATRSGRAALDTEGSSCGARAASCRWSGRSSSARCTRSRPASWRSRRGRSGGRARGTCSGRHPIPARERAVRWALVVGARDPRRRVGRRRPAAAAREARR